jgi:hypothetical protein
MSCASKFRQRMHHLRDHWCVEDDLHHRALHRHRESRPRIEGNGREMISTFRRLSRSLRKFAPVIKENVPGKPLLAGWTLDYVTEILPGFQAT